MITRLPLRVCSTSTIPRTLSRASLQCSNSSGPQIPLAQRQYSTPTINATPEQPLRHFVPRQPKPKRRLRPYIYATLFGLLGVMTAEYCNLIISPPPLPLPGSHEDQLMVEHLAKTAEKIPLVKSLMEDPNWVHHEAYGGFNDADKHKRLTTGPLSGARGLGGFQRVFYNEDTGEHIVVAWIGGALAGWPGVTHGGVTATLMDEALGRCAITQLPGRTGVTANLELNYMKPLVTNSFYVIRSSPQKEGSTETKQFVRGRMETLDGRVCVEAKALFVVPKKFKTKPLRNL